MTDRTFGPQTAKFDGGLGNVKPDDLARELNKIPLFMTELPEEDNDAMVALQSLIYDGPAEEVAENFKNQGNDAFKSGPEHYQDAITYYTKALEAQCNDMKLIEIIYVNRAAVNLELQLNLLENYRRVLNDCAQALKLNPKNVKAYYRSAKALYALDKMDEALDCCERGLQIEPQNKAFQTEKQKCLNHKQVLDQKRREKTERDRTLRETKEAIDRSINSRGIRTKTTSDAPSTDAQVHLDPENPDRLIWPVFFLYPEYRESDFISQFHEDDTFLDHLEVMFESPAPWDKDFKYKPKTIKIYFETDSDDGDRVALVNIEKQVTLGEALKNKKYVVKNRIPSFIILTDDRFGKEFVSRYQMR
ncbi:5122_t:CDS:2 [Paraglomus occultum]|uniref:5122_t:CDS:1 n=1 Tax=Paraglomus occultum TaxID=144539 RepID=A0A9N9A3K6_9GLOM|nr:5122_t:CDS:2 [Paraglomus occultum]